MNRQVLEGIVGPALAARGAGVAERVTRESARELAACGLRLPDVATVVARSINTDDRTAVEPTVRRQVVAQMEMS